jgi:hypothetical protein
MRRDWDPGDEALWRISGTTGAVVETIRTGRNPAVVAAGAGDVWVTIHEGGEVWRIHPS